MTELHFVVVKAPDGGYVARAMGVDIFTEADDMQSLRSQVLDAVRCHFEDGRAPSLVKLFIDPEDGFPA